MSQTNFENLVKWFRQEGGYFHEALERRTDKNGVPGIYTRKPISGNQELIKIPNRLVITPDLNPDLPQDWDRMVKIIYNVLLEKHKGSESFFEVALRVLPSLEDFKQFHPYFISEEEQAKLEKIYGLIKLFRESYQQELKHIIELIQAFRVNGVFSEAEITWSFFIYKTRSWSDGVIPILDMFNHSNNLGAMKTNKSEPVLGPDGLPLIGSDGNPQEIKYHLLISRVDYYPDDQVYDSYGFKDNFRLAYDYGFQDPKNQDLVIPLQVNYTGMSSLHFAIAQLLLNRRGMNARIKEDKSIYCDYQNYYQANDQRGIVNAFTDQGVTDDLLKLFRIFAIDNYSELEAGQGQISRALKLIKNYILDMLKGISLTEVRAELAKTDLSTGYRTCLTTIERRILILRKCLEWIEQQHQTLLD